jgi:hypothetical protein
VFVGEKTDSWRGDRERQGREEKYFKGIQGSFSCEYAFCLKRAHGGREWGAR